MRRLVAAVCVALTVAGVLAVLPAAEVGALAPHRVSMVPSKVEVDLPGSIRLNGSVPTASPGKGVVIDQLFGSSWRPVATGRTDRSRRYSIGFAPRTPGYLKLRARVGGDRSRGGSVSPASTIAVYRWRLLVDESPVQNDSFGTGNTSINGTAYRNSIGIAARDYSRRVEYNLRRRCVEYRAVIGLMDDSEADAVADVRVDVDGNPLFNQRLNLTTVRAVRLNTRGWLRLALRVQSNVGIFGNPPVVSFAESKIRCLF